MKWGLEFMKDQLWPRGPNAIDLIIELIGNDHRFLTSWGEPEDGVTGEGEAVSSSGGAAVEATAPGMCAGVHLTSSSGGSPAREAGNGGSCLLCCLFCHRAEAFPCHLHGSGLVPVESPLRTRLPCLQSG